VCVARLSRVSASAAAAAAAAGVRDAGAVPSLDPAVSHRGGGGRAARRPCQHRSPGGRHLRSGRSTATRAAPRARSSSLGPSSCRQKVDFSPWAVGGVV